MDYVIRHQNTSLDCRLDWLKMTWTETAVQSIFQSSPVQSRLNLQSNRLDLQTLTDATDRVSRPHICMDASDRGGFWAEVLLHQASKAWGGVCMQIHTTRGGD